MQISITNGTLTSISETLSPSSGYALPSTISVSGATSSYNSTSGVVTLTDITSTMSLTAIGIITSVTYRLNWRSVIYNDNVPDNAILTSDNTYLKDANGNYLTTTEIVGYSGNIIAGTSRTPDVHNETYFKLDSDTCSSTNYDGYVNFTGNLTGVSSFSNITKIALYCTSVGGTIAYINGNYIETNGGLQVVNLTADGNITIYGLYTYGGGSI